MLIIGIIVAFGLFAQSFLFSKGDTVYVRLRVVDRDIQYMDEGMPLSRIANQYKKGLSSKDGLGRITAEIIAIEGYDRKYNTDTYTEKEDIFLTLKLRASYSQRSNEYKYQGMTIASGEWLNVTFGALTVHGFIVDVSSNNIMYSKETLTIQTLYQSATDANGEIDQYMIDGVSVGDTVTDTFGNIVAEVVDKQVTPSRLLTVDQYGMVHTAYHTIKKDMILTIRMRVERRNNEVYYQDSVTVKKGATLPLFFPRLILYSKIITIQDVGK